jgi:hypothetical protein
MVIVSKSRRLVFRLAPVSLLFSRHRDGYQRGIRGAQRPYADEEMLKMPFAVEW